ncbi:ankyrin homolog [Ylistrum balloti]|uniref:ankyrin homolog n=1 Tax=Ylistrum balloti TaxID=509963 RepID=UPI002905BBF6|nr:ankyrin homolog [Ylistrum balloti]XP_060082114.1 ankyrin homolog [Ylistrum balloti]
MSSDPSNPSDVALRLYHALEEDERGELTQLLKSGADVHYKYFGEKSLLHICCEKDRLECAKILIEYGANVQAQDEWNMTPLMYCMVRQLNDIAEELLSRDPAAVQSQDRFGKASIHSAVESGSLELLSLLLSYGASADQTDWFGITPLMSVCSRPGISNSVALCEMLLEAGADVNLKDLRSRRTALQFAAFNKLPSLVEVLLQAGADPNTQDTASRTPLTNLIFQSFRLQNASCDVDDDLMTIVIMLTQSGADLNMNHRENANPVCMAAAYRVEALIRFFMDCGADPNIRFPLDVTSLLVAVKKGDAGCVRALLQWNARTDIRGRVYRTADTQYWVDPMELAVDLGCWDIVPLLYSAGYNISRLPYLHEGAMDSELPESLLGNTEMMSWLLFLASSPKPLFHLTVLSLWRILDRNFREKISDLPLPKTIKQLMNPDFVIG